MPTNERDTLSWSAQPPLVASWRAKSLPLPSCNRHTSGSFYLPAASAPGSFDIPSSPSLDTLVVMGLGYGSVYSFFGFMCFVGLGNGMTIPNATAGTLSVRPHLAGTASGLGGAIMIGGGAALSALAGALLHPGTGAYPVLWIQFLTGVAGVGAILLVIMREQRLGGLDLG